MHAHISMLCHICLVLDLPVGTTVLCDTFHHGDMHTKTPCGMQCVRVMLKDVGSEIIYHSIQYGIQAFASSL